jgi:hypothetical protein
MASESSYFNHKTSEESFVLNSISSTSPSGEISRNGEDSEAKGSQIFPETGAECILGQQGAASSFQAQDPASLKIKLKFGENSFELLSKNREPPKSLESLQISGQPESQLKRLNIAEKPRAVPELDRPQIQPKSTFQAKKAGGRGRSQSSQGSILFDFGVSEKPLSQEEELQVSLRSAARFNEKLVIRREGLKPFLEKKEVQSHLFEIDGDGGSFPSFCQPFLCQDGFGRTRLNPNGSLEARGISVQGFIKLNVDNEFSRPPIIHRAKVGMGSQMGQRRGENSQITVQFKSTGQRAGDSNIMETSILSKTHRRFLNSRS